MGKFIKQGRVVIMLSGRFAGKKAVVIKCNDDGNKERKFSHALVVGIQKYPRKVTKRMSQKKVLKRTNIKPFIKYVNLNHLMPTRYLIQGELDFKEIVKEDKITPADKKKEVKKQLKLLLQDKYRNLPTGKANEKASHLRFFFKKLRF